MAKTGSPYLESGESLVLTTDRISVNTVQYDMLLTTRYLILVDIRYAQFQPKKIPLLTIQSVKGGKTANGELVITLFFTETGGSDRSESMVLLFSQQPFEQRKRERDDWLKTLMGLIVSVRQETSYDSITGVDPEIGIRPSKRRQIAPEIPHPHTKVVESRPAQIELIIVPDELESPVIPEETQEIPEMSFSGEKPETEAIPAPCAMEETPCASQEPTVSPDTQMPPVPVGEDLSRVSQEISESPGIRSPSLPRSEETPADSEEVSGSLDTFSPSEVPIIVESVRVPTGESVSQETAPLVPAFGEIPVDEEADSGLQKTVSVSLMASVKSLTSPSGWPEGANTWSTSDPDSEETPVALPEMMVLPDTSLPQKETNSVESLYKTEENAEPILPQKTSIIEEKPVASQEVSVSPDLPDSTEPVPVESAAVPGQNILPAEPMFPETGNGNESVQQPAPEATPPAPGSPRPPAGPGSRRLIFIAVAAIILIILGIAGVMVFYPQNPTEPGVEPTPLPTPTIQQTPQPTPVIIPSTGVWVRVDYPRSYYGWIGNTGSLRGVNGSGDQIYKIPEIEGIVQVQLYKPDNSGDTLTVAVYRDGKVISLRYVSTPMGSIELLIDAKTGSPPAMTPVVTPSGNQTGSNVGRIMYF